MLLLFWRVVDITKFAYQSGYISLSEGEHDESTIVHGNIIAGLDLVRSRVRAGKPRVTRG